MTSKTEIQPGTVVHFLESKNVYQSTNFLDAKPALSMGYGMELELTAEIIEANRNQAGDSFLDLLDNEPAQISRWGKVTVRRGPWPADTVRTLPGSEAHFLQRDIARDAAWQETNPARRARLLKEVEAKFGPGRSSQNSASYNGGLPWERDRG